MPNVGPMEFVLLSLMLAIVVVPIVLVGLYADRKGYSYALFAFLGILITWPVALLLAVVLPRRPSTVAPGHP